MRVIKNRVLRGIASFVAIVAVLGLAAYLRVGTFWAAHTDPVELSYLTLAMKKGTHSGLIGYGVSGMEIRRTHSVVAGDPGATLSITTPFVVDSTAADSFDGWAPQDSNPFYYKPPYFPALLAYSHHVLLGPRFAFYPVNLAEPESGQSARLSQAIFQIQGWAVGVPFVFGVIAVLLTGIIGRQMFGLGRGILGAFLTAVYPAHVLVAMRIWPEAILTVCVLAAFFLFLHFASTRNPWGCLLAGAAWGIGALTDSAALFFVPAFVMWAFWTQKKFLNGYLAGFVLGAGVIYKVWPDYLHYTFNNSVLRAADTSSASASGFTAHVMPVLMETLILWMIPVAALVATGWHLVQRYSARQNGEGSNNMVILWLMIMSFVVSRFLFSIHAPCDARALAPVLPFVILLAVQKRRIL